MTQAINEILKSHLLELIDQQADHELSHDVQLMVMSYSENVWATAREQGFSQEEATSASALFERRALALLEA